MIFSRNPKWLNLIYGCGGGILVLRMPSESILVEYQLRSFSPWIGIYFAWCCRGRWCCSGSGPSYFYNKLKSLQYQAYGHFEFFYAKSAFAMAHCTSRSTYGRHECSPQVVMSYVIIILLGEQTRHHVQNLLTPSGQGFIRMSVKLGRT